MKRAWHIGLPGWTIQDGNYDDFAIGDLAKFAVEFYFPKNPATSKHTQIKIVHNAWAHYQVSAPVAAMGMNAWVLDLGILAFSERKPPRGVRNGTQLQGEVYLEIDPYFYFEYLHTDTSLPPLIYSWRIREIWRNLTPRIPKRRFLSRVWVRDESNIRWEPVDRTDAWNHDDAEYVLVCELTDYPPARTL